MGFLIIALISESQEATALEVCNDPPCSAGCESSCTYQACTGTAEQTFSVQELPFTITLPDAACEGVESDTTTYDTLPFPHEGTPYNTLPAEEVTDRYNICETLTVNNDEPCPPPPPPPFP